MFPSVSLQTTMISLLGKFIFEYNSQMLF